jgi:hypothetical protein
MQDRKLQLIISINIVFFLSLALFPRFLVYTVERDEIALKGTERKLRVGIVYNTMILKDLCGW